MKTQLTSIILFSSLLCLNAQEWTWSEDTLSYAREGLSAAVLDDSIFFSGGRLYNYSFVNTVDVYDVGDDEWSTVELQSSPRWWTCAVSCNGKVFFAGGNNLPGNSSFADVDIYDKETGAWTVEYLSVARNYIGATAHGNKVFFAGGIHMMGPIFYDVIDIYDTETGIWDTLYLTEPKGAISAVAAGGKVLFAGGITDVGTPTDDVEIWDINNGEWTYDSLSEARAVMGEVAYGNKVYFAGGLSSTGSSSNMVEIYNVETEGWETPQTLSFPMIVRALNVKDALVFSGECLYINSNGNYTIPDGTIEIYYPETGQWDLSVPDLNPARVQYACAAYNDKAYYAGGYPGGASLTDEINILEYHDFHCLPDGITFTTQEEIDNFQTNYPYCTEIEGDVNIYGDNISDLSGMNVITAIGGDLKINSNDILYSLSGLDSLTSIGGKLEIAGNPVLSELSGLDNITSIGGNLEIIGNEVITSLTGLENIESESIIDLSIWGNSALSECDIWNICYYINTTNGNIEIHDNTGECETLEDVIEACINDIVELSTADELKIFPNPLGSNAIVSYNLKQNSLVILEILDLRGRLVATLLNENQQQGEKIAEFNSHELKPGIYFCVLKTGEGILTQKIVKL